MRYYQLVLVFLYIALPACVKQEDTIRYLFINSTSTDIEFLYPRHYSNDVHFSWGTMYDLEPTDTTAYSAYNAHFTWQHFPPNSQGVCDSGYATIEGMSPYDTVRIFVFDASCYYPPYTNSDCIKRYESEDYYCRYDLTSKDLHSLVDQTGNIRISFPPTVEMSSVKMFPDYKTLSKTFESWMTTTESLFD